MNTSAKALVARRLNPRDLVVIDVLTGLVVCVLALGYGLGPHEAVVSMPAVVIVLLALAIGAAVVLRRHFPWPAVWAVAIASPLVSMESLSSPLAVQVAMALVLYMLAVRGPQREAARGLAVILGCTALGLLATKVGLITPRLPRPLELHAWREEALGLLIAALQLCVVWVIGVAVSASRV